MQKRWEFTGEMARGQMELPLPSFPFSMKEVSVGMPYVQTPMPRLTSYSLASSVGHVGREAEEQMDRALGLASVLSLLQ